jgi:hypothetical protein
MNIHTINDAVGQEIVSTWLTKGLCTHLKELAHTEGTITGNIKEPLHTPVKSRRLITRHMIINYLRKKLNNISINYKQIYKNPE